jgi:excisionase family DNA binding protein
VADDLEFLSTSPAAHILRVAEMTVRAMADRGELPCIRTSTGARLFRRRDVEQLARLLDKQRLTAVKSADIAGEDNALDG